MFEKQKSFPLLPQVTTVGENIISANNNFTGNNTFAGDTTFTGNVKDGNGNDFVTEVDYATENNAGVVQIGDGISVDENGVISSTEVTVDGQVVSTFDADTKANIDGFYEGMTVGHALEADQLASDREIEDADEACPPITFGAIGGTAEVQDGYSKFEEIRGNTICWSQLLKNPGFVDETFQWSSYRLIHTESNGICSYLATQANPNMYQGISRIVGHKYLMTARVKLTSATEASPYFKIAFAGSTAYAALNTNWQYLSFIATSPSSVASSLDIIDERASDWDVVQISNVCLIDLTQMFGAGNEPSTVEEFTSRFPNPYYAYNAGQLLSSKSASMILRRRNQLNLNRTAGTLSGFGNDNPRAFEEGKYYAGLTVNNYYSDANVSDVTITSDSITYTNTQSGYGIAMPVHVIAGQTYLAETKNVTGNTIAIAWFDKDGNIISFSGGNAYYHSAQAPVNAYWGVPVLQAVAGTHTYTEIQFRLYYDTPNLPYVPYEEQVVTLPNIELRSAGTARDVAYQTGGGKRRIGSVDLGTLDYSEWGSTETVTQYYSSGLDSLAKKLGQGICPRFTLSSSKDVNTFYIGNGNNGNFYIRTAKDQYESASAFQTAMDGVILYYELATEIDITLEENPGWTELVKIDNFGTIEFTTSPVQNLQVPQAYFIRYTVNLGEWVDSAYVKTNGDPNNIITNTDYASSSEAGVVKVDSSRGITIDSNGRISTNPAPAGSVKSGVSSYLPIAPYYQHQSVFYGLSRAAGVNLATSTSETAPDGTNPGVYPTETIQAILKMILPAAPTTDGTYDLVCTVSSGTPTFSWVART